MKQHILDNAKEYPLLAERMTDKEVNVVRQYVLDNPKEHPRLAARMNEKEVDGKR